LIAYAVLVMIMKQVKFISLGYVSNDYIARVPEIPIDNKVKMTVHSVQGGGPAGGAAVCAARLGVSCAFVSSVGADDAGKKILADLAADNVDISAVKVRQNCGSPIAYCWVDDAGRRSVVWTMNDLELLRADEIPAELIAQAELLHLDGHHPEAAWAAAQAAKAAGVKVALDAGTLNESTGRLAAVADIVITSEPFALAATGSSDPVAAVKTLRQMYPQAEVTGATFGGKGSYFFLDGEVVHIPPFAVDVVDTTGAGDSFHAGFEVAYIESNEVRYAARFGSAVAAIKCGKLGARAGLPDRSAVEKFLKENC